MKNNSGFTMFEVLVALTLMGLILMSLQMALNSSLVAQDEINREMAGVEIGPEILDRIERDLMALHLSNIKDNDIFIGRRDTQRGQPADRLDFLSRVRSSSTRKKEGFDEALARADVNEIGYRLRGSEENLDFLELWRREDFFVDEEPFEGGHYERLYDRVKSLKIIYLDELGDEAQEFEEWSVKENGMLPAAIKIRLAIEPVPMQEAVVNLPDSQRREEFVFERVITFPPQSDETLRIRPLIPDMELAMSDEILGGQQPSDENGDGSVSNENGGGDGVVGGGPGGGGGDLGGGGRGGGARGGGARDGGLMGGGAMNGGRGLRGGGGGSGGGGRGGGGGGGFDGGDGGFDGDDKARIEKFLEQWLNGG